ncbi:hypothetical protein DQ238_18310 [Geodermatophilus sp. TF02-6]|nr:hypothetical protein DQ238_18310 [Geodermatophilus sp. TF02-6]
MLLVAPGCDVDRAAEGWRRWHERTGSAQLYGAVSALPHDAGLVVRVAAHDGQLLRGAVAEALPLLRASAVSGRGSPS